MVSIVREGGIKEIIKALNTNRQCHVGVAVAACGALQNLAANGEEVLVVDVLWHGCVCVE